MSGLIALALFVYKKVTNISSSNKKTKMLSVEEVLNINPRKALMVVKAGNERFLIASDVDKTTLISKLNDKQDIISAITDKQIDIVPQSSVVDLGEIKTSVDSENMNVLFPEKSETKITATKDLKLKEKKSENKPIEKKKSKEIHLEIISNKNPNAPERNRHQTKTNRRKNVTIEVGEIKNHGLSTIKEIVHKVKEL
jgi:flagellar biogenesis protein FliO